MKQKLGLLCLILTGFITCSSIGMALADEPSLEETKCKIVDLSQQVQTNLGPADAYTVCSNYSNQFINKCEEAGLKCTNIELRCPNASGHAIVFVEVGDGMCIVADPSREQKTVIGKPFKCSDLDKGNIKLPPEYCGKKANSKEQCTCKVKEPDGGIHHTQVSNPSFGVKQTDSIWTSLHSGLTPGITQLTKCMNVCDETHETHLKQIIFIYGSRPSQEAEDYLQSTNRWYRDCINACKNAYE